MLGGDDNRIHTQHSLQHPFPAPYYAILQSSNSKSKEVVTRIIDRLVGLGPDRQSSDAFLFGSGGRQA